MWSCACDAPVPVTERVVCVDRSVRSARASRLSALSAHAPAGSASRAPRRPRLGQRLFVIEKRGHPILFVRAFASCTDYTHLAPQTRARAHTLRTQTAVVGAPPSSTCANTRHGYTSRHGTSARVYADRTTPSPRTVCFFVSRGICEHREDAIVAQLRGHTPHIRMVSEDAAAAARPAFFECIESFGKIGSFSRGRPASHGGAAVDVLLGDLGRESLEERLEVQRRRRVDLSLNQVKHDFPCVRGGAPPGAKKGESAPQASTSPALCPSLLCNPLLAHRPE